MATDKFIYIASHDKSMANSAAEIVSRSGYEIVSTWHYGEFKKTDECTKKECQEKATRDLEQIKMCDFLMLLSGPDKYSGGKFVEAGIAIGMGKRVDIIGRIENMLLFLPPPMIVVYSCIEAWVDWRSI